MVRWIVPVLILAIFAGCGGDAPPKTALPKTEPVTGVVTLDDQPLEGASVTFIPTGTTTGVECVGQTDAAGKYSPKQIRGADGVPAGNYKVVISRQLKGGKPVVPGQAAGEGGIAVESLPPHYSRAAESKLTATVNAGGGTIDFKLTSK